MPEKIEMITENNHLLLRKALAANHRELMDMLAANQKAVLDALERIEKVGRSADY